MSANAKLREQIAELIGRPNAVDFEEIESVLNKLGCESRKTKHGYLFRLEGGRTLMLNKHNDGRSHLPRYCVMDFRDQMLALGYYAEEQ